MSICGTLRVRICSIFQLLLQHLRESTRRTRIPFFLFPIIPRQSKSDQKKYSTVSQIQQLNFMHQKQFGHETLWRIHAVHSQQIKLKKKTTTTPNIFQTESQSNRTLQRLDNPVGLVQILWLRLTQRSLPGINFYWSK